MNGFIVTAVANEEGAFPIVTPVELISNYADAADPIRIIRLQSGEVQELGDRGFYESEDAALRAAKTQFVETARNCLLAATKISEQLKEQGIEVIK